MKLEITVERKRLSATQGEAAVYFNGVFVQSFGDRIELVEQGKRYFGQVIGGWASVVPDIDFIRGTLIHDYEKAYDYHRPMGKALMKIRIDTEGKERKRVYAKDTRGNMFILFRNLPGDEAEAEAEKWFRNTGLTAVVVTEEEKGER